MQFITKVWYVNSHGLCIHSLLPKLQVRMIHHQPLLISALLTSPNRTLKVECFPFLLFMFPVFLFTYSHGLCIHWLFVCQQTAWVAVLVISLLCRSECHEQELIPLYLLVSAVEIILGCLCLAVCYILRKENCLSFNPCCLLMRCLPWFIKCLVLLPC
jgi:hypothetical protein